MVKCRQSKDWLLYYFNRCYVSHHVMASTKRNGFGKKECTPPVYFNDTHREKLFFSIQYKKFNEIQGWLLLTFFICLQNQLSSIQSISHVNKEHVCSNNIFHQIDRKWMVAPFTNFYGKIWVGFCLNTKKRFCLRSFILKPRERA